MISKFTYACVIAIWQIKKKEKEFGKHVKSTSRINENWILILNNYKVVLHFRTNKAVLFYLPSLLTSSPSQRKCTHLHHQLQIISRPCLLNAKYKYKNRYICFTFEVSVKVWHKRCHIGGHHSANESIQPGTCWKTFMAVHLLV